MKTEKTIRPIPGLSREDEEKQLAEIIKIAQDNLERAKGHIGQLSEELHDLMETYGPKDKEALSLIHNTQSQLQEYKRDLMRCRKARKKPYFGRIDFKNKNQPQDESYYVGRVGISENGSDPVVIDWRAPAAAVYYENTLGPCKYVVKNEGICHINLKRKRTYEIENDVLKDFFESDVVANDELLTKYLAKNKKAVLGEIIATIQKEQNAIIRKSPKTNMIVQGVAGSGKTTVAMHRISYILYNYENEFRPEDFYIIGSNRILLNYITGVLPDLDVYGVSQMTMEQLFVRLLYEEWNPEIHQISSILRQDESSGIKGSFEWFHDLETFCGEYEKMVIPCENIYLGKNRVLLLSADAILAYLSDNRKMSMQSKIHMLNKILQAKLENELSGRSISNDQEEKKELQRRYRWYFGKEVWKGSIFELYRRFLDVQAQKGKAVTVLENQYDVYDLAALAYLYKRMKETDGIREASHVIIDEAQDFGMMAYGALAYCLRGCTYTIMGDVSQNIHYGYGLNDWKDLKKLILTGPYDSFGLLKKSYRNTVEISAFATEILKHGNFSIYPAEPIIRHGSQVRVKECTDEKHMIQTTEKTIQKWLKERYETIAVICCDREETAEVTGYLAKSISLVNTELETTEFGSGVMVLPVEYTKGLEFDAVLIYNPSSENYPAKDQYVKLLYVAATRALHELMVVHQGNLTELIGKPVSGEKHMRSLESEITGKTGQYTRKIITDREQERLDAEQGNKEREMRSNIGPKPVNPSIHKFGEAPDSSMLQPRGHSRIDNSVRIIRKTKKALDLISNYGILRLTPLSDTVIRVQFMKGRMEEFEKGFWYYEEQSPVKWTAKEGKTLAEVATDTLKVRISKKSGAIQFLDKNGKLLLAEKEALPRQIETSVRFQNWIYFDWPNNEIISAKGILEEHLERMNQKARYISFGGKQLRMPLLVSEYGYGIGVAADQTVMCCDIPMYGPYLYTEGVKQIDYYFLYGGNYQKTLQLYKKLKMYGNRQEGKLI